MRRSVTLALLLGRSAAPAATAAPLEPLVLGWARFFTISGDAFQQRGQPVVGGYVRNEAGFTAIKVRLLVEGLDQSGQVVSQRVGWLGYALTPGTRAYFELPAGGGAARYRVRVFDYDWLLSASFQAP